MLPDLIEAQPTVNVGFDFVLPHDLFTTLSLIVKSSWRDGFSEWVYQTAAALGPAGRAEVATLTPFLAEAVRGPAAPVALLPPTHPAWREFPAFESYLTAHPDSFYAGLAERFVTRQVDSLHEPAPTTPDDLRRLLRRRLAVEQTNRGPDLVHFDPDLALALAEDPVILRARLTQLLARFGVEYMACLTREAPLVRHALSYHGRQGYRGLIDDIFASVTGRALPPAWHPAIDATTEVVFVPSLHIGPYFFIVTMGLRGFVSFNARTVGVGRQTEPATPEVVHMFPPLRALADETRLHILAHLQAGEQTQESLMAALGISQPTASRHLGLLERVGLLRVRRELGVKYYSVNREGGRNFVKALEGFIS